jgi:hypothetical protein
MIRVGDKHLTRDYTFNGATGGAIRIRNFLSLTQMAFSSLIGAMVASAVPPSRDLISCQRRNYIWEFSDPGDTISPIDAKFVVKVFFKCNSGHNEKTRPAQCCRSILIISRAVEIPNLALFQAPSLNILLQYMTITAVPTQVACQGSIMARDMLCVT